MALSWMALAAPAGARPQPDLAELDLRVRPADVAAPKRPKLAEPLAPSHPTLGDVDSPEALAEYQAGKRAHKAALRAAAAASSD